MVRNLLFLLFFVMIFPMISLAGRGNDSIFIWKFSAVSNDWNAPENWVGGSIPGSTGYVFIPAATFQPNISSNVSIKALTVNPDGILNVSYPGILIISDSLILKNRSAFNIKPRGSVNVNGPTKLEGIHCLVVKSDESGTGSFIDNGNITGPGTAKIQQYTEGLKWQMISSPIAGAVSGLYLYQYLKPFLESSNQLGGNITSLTMPLVKGVGFGLWPVASQTFEYSGKPNTGIVSSGIYFTDISKGYNLVGNPYPSSIDWNAASGWDCNASISDWLVIFNPFVNNYGMYLKNSGTGTNGVSNIIPPGQGYFIRAIDNDPVFSVNNAARSANTMVPFFKQDESVSCIRLNVSGSVGSDEIILNFKPGSSEYYDVREDGMKLYGPSDSPQAYMVIQPGETKVSVNTLPALLPDMKIPVFVDFGQEGSYDITAAGISSLPDGVNVILEDNKTGIVCNLALENHYSFHVANGDTANRFLLHFFSGPIGVSEMNNDPSVAIYSSGKNVYVKFADPSDIPSTLTIFDMTGRQVGDNVKLHDQTSHISLNVSSGNYLVKVTAPSGIFSQKVFIP